MGSELKKILNRGLALAERFIELRELEAKAKVKQQEYELKVKLELNKKNLLGISTQGRHQLP